MNVEATWFGPPERELFGWLHLPQDGRARGTLVCCPPIGTEALSSHRALRQLAGKLAARGFAVLRFDYAGTGNSAGSGEEGVDAWRDSLRQALDFARRLGTPCHGAVGLRLGATLAAFEAGRNGGLDALALWDPCASGRSFLREQQALAAVSLEGEGVRRSTVAPDRVTELLGWTLSPKGRQELEGLRMEDLELPLAGRSLLLTRDDRPTAGVFRRWQAQDTVDWEPARGQRELIDVLPNRSLVPDDTLELIASWFDRTLPAERVPLRASLRPEALLGGPKGGPAVRERALRLGPLGLFAVSCEPDAPSSGATVVFLNSGIIHHVGPARLWVTLSRQLAAQGLRAVRLDLSGLGESPVRPGQRPHIVHPTEAMDDVRMALEGLGLDPSEAVLAGLCSGAYHAVEAGLRLPLRGACAINPILVFDPPSPTGPGDSPGREAVQPFRGWVRWLRRFQRLAAWGEHRAPPALWWLADRTGLQPSPARPLGELGERGVPLAMICGPVEARPFLRRGRWTVESLRRRGLLTLDLLENADHALFGAEGRAQACRLVLGRLNELAGTSGEAPTSEPGPSPELTGAAGGGRP